jgi:uncharacterized protein YpiB (UPF0302 family)
MQITEEILEELRTITNAKEQITLELGRNEATMVRLKFEKQKLEANYLEVLKKDAEISMKINKLHGNVNIDLSDGKIVPIQ